MAAEEQPASVQDALAALLGSLGFRAMSEQARSERDPEKLQLYARIIVKEAPPERKPALIAKLRALDLL